MMTEVKAFKINRSFKAVYTSVKRRADKCLNVKTLTPQPGSYGGSRHADFYSSKTYKTGESKAETTLQRYTPNLVGPELPEGGMYLMVFDIEKASAKRTNVTFSGATFLTGLKESLVAWAKGKKHRCPKIAPFGSDYQYGVKS